MKCIARKRRLLKYLRLLFSDVFIVAALLLTPQNNSKYFKIKNAEKSTKKQIVRCSKMFTKLRWKTSDAKQKTCICNCINCVHNCEDHSTSFDFISAVLIWFISYTSITFSHLLHRNIWTHNWPAPNISGFIAQFVGASLRYREVEGSNSVEVLNFF